MNFRDVLIAEWCAVHVVHTIRAWISPFQSRSWSFLNGRNPGPNDSNERINRSSTLQQFKKKACSCKNGRDIDVKREELRGATIAMLRGICDGPWRFISSVGTTTPCSTTPPAHSGLFKTNSRVVSQIFMSAFSFPLVSFPLPQPFFIRCFSRYSHLEWALRFSGIKRLCGDGKCRTPNVTFADRAAYETHVYWWDYSSPWWLQFRFTGSPEVLSTWSCLLLKCCS